MMYIENTEARMIRYFIVIGQGSSFDLHSQMVTVYFESDHLFNYHLPNKKADGKCLVDIGEWAKVYEYIPVEADANVVVWERVESANTAQKDKVYDYGARVTTVRTASTLHLGTDTMIPVNVAVQALHYHEMLFDEIYRFTTDFVPATWKFLRSVLSENDGFYNMAAECHTHTALQALLHSTYYTQVILNLNIPDTCKLAELKGMMVEMRRVRACPVQTLDARCKTNEAMISLSKSFKKKWGLKASDSDHPLSLIMDINAVLQEKYNIAVDNFAIKTECTLTCPAQHTWNIAHNYESTECKFPPDWVEVRKLGERPRAYAPEELFAAQFRTRENDDPVRCSTCKASVKCTKTYKILSLPNVLVMGFQRSTFKVSVGQSRRNCLVSPNRLIKICDTTYKLKSVWFHQAQVDSPIDEMDTKTREAAKDGHWLSVNIFEGPLNSEKLAMLNDSNCRIVVNNVLNEGQNWLKISGLVYEVVQADIAKPSMHGQGVRCSCKVVCTEHKDLLREGEHCDKTYYLKLSRAACQHSPTCIPTHDHFPCNSFLALWIQHLLLKAHIEMGIY